MSEDQAVKHLAKIVEAIEWARAEGYRRGYDVAKARAVSRTDLGLPIEDVRAAG